MRDLHVHTKFSCDSDADIEAYVLKGIKNGICQICFTDHVDLNKNDFGYNYYQADRFFDDFSKMKGQYADQMELLAGIEFGEPHLYYESLSKLSSLPYDYIIGSIHWIGNMFPCQSVREKYSAKEFYSLYWDEVLKTAQIGGFNAIGHIDFPKRYYNEIYYRESILNEIFRNLIEKGIVMEINTSSLRKGCSEMMPDREILEIYKNNGGQFITIGSDSHIVEDLGTDYEKAKTLIQELELQEVTFIQGKCKMVC